MENVVDQVWEDEVSGWKFRNLGRRMFLNIVRNLNGKILEVGSGYGRALEGSA